MSSILELRHFRLVRAIAEEGGPTRAAARLHLTQSAVSHQLAELEGRLGVVLFKRVRRQLKLTSAGTRILDASRDLLAGVARLERDIHRASAPRRELFRIAVECFTSYHWLSTVVTGLAKKHPLIDLLIVLEARREPIAALLRGELDIALTSSPVRDRDLVAEPLFDDEWTVILAPTHRLVARPHITAVELGRETLLAQDAPRSDVERLRELIAAERAPMPRVQNVPLTDVMVELVKAGLGVGLVSRWAVEPHLDRGDVVARRFTRDGLPEHWSVVCRRDAQSGFPLALFAELVRSTRRIALKPEAKARRLPSVAKGC